MSLQEKIQTELVAALKSKDDIKVQALRLVMAQIKDTQIEKRAPLSDEEVVRILHKLSKQHDEAIAFYRQGKREDLVNKEETEKKIIGSFMPQALSEAEINTVIDQVIVEVGKGNFGQVMGMVMKKIAGRADGQVIAELVKSKLD